MCVFKWFFALLIGNLYKVVTVLSSLLINSLIAVVELVMWWECCDKIINKSRLDTSKYIHCHNIPCALFTHAWATAICPQWSASYWIYICWFSPWEINAGLIADNMLHYRSQGHDYYLCNSGMLQVMVKKWVNFYKRSTISCFYY